MAVKVSNSDDSIKGGKLWVFGDSFAMEPNAHYDYKNSSDWIWPRQLASNLPNCDAVRLVGRYGISNEYLMKMLSDFKFDLTPKDYIVVITTSIMRQWLFPDAPELSNLHGLWYKFNNAPTALAERFHSEEEYDEKKGITKKQKKAFNAYYDELFLLNSAKRGQMFLEAFLGWIEFIFRNNVPNIITLAGFDVQNLHTSNYNLCDIDEAEFKTNEIKRKFLFAKGNDGADPRVMHLSQPNHDVLAEKIYTGFMTRQDIDLTTGFHKNLFEGVEFKNWRADTTQITEEKDLNGVTLRDENVGQVVSTWY